MKTLKGQNFRATISTVEGKKYFAGSQSCNIHKSADLEEVSCKDSTGMWKQQSVVALSWDGGVNGLVIMDVDGNSVSNLDALDMVGATLDITFEEATGEKNRQAVSGGIVYEGSAIINDGSFQFDNKANSTYTLQFTGNGELKKKSIAEIFTDAECTTRPSEGVAYNELYISVNKPMNIGDSYVGKLYGCQLNVTEDTDDTALLQFNTDFYYKSIDSSVITPGVYKLTASGDFETYPEIF